MLAWQSILWKLKTISKSLLKGHLNVYKARKDPPLGGIVNMHIQMQWKIHRNEETETLTDKTESQLSNMVIFKKFKQ